MNMYCHPPCRILLAANITMMVHAHVPDSPASHSCVRSFSRTMSNAVFAARPGGFSFEWVDQLLAVETFFNYSENWENQSDFMAVQHAP